MKSQKLQLILFICFATCKVLSQYPLINQTIQHNINGTIGEERHLGGAGTATRHRYHYGLDFFETDGTRVYSIEGGTFHKINGSQSKCTVGHFAYIHVDNHQFTEGSTVPANTFIGEIQSGLGHVHMQQSTIDLVSIVGDQDPGNGWINRLNNLTPFVDNVAPHIDWVRLYRDGDNTATNNISTDLELFEKIDILLNSEDNRISATGGHMNPLGTNNGFGNAPKIMNWEILDQDFAVLREFPGINFTNVPPNASALTVHGPAATWQTPNFEYWITHDPFNTPYDKYWNSRKMKNAAYHVSANYPWDCDINEGQMLKFRVYSRDGTTNIASVTLPTITSNNYIIDNFQPFIKGVNVYFSNNSIKVYGRQWDPITTPESGIELGEVVEGGLPDITNAGDIVVYANTSESMDRIRARIPTLFGSNSTPVEGTLLQLGDRTSWKFNFGHNYTQLDYGQCHRVLFEGTDFGNNNLIDFEIDFYDAPYCSLTNDSTSRVPKRTGTNTWDHAVASGVDQVHTFRILECGHHKITSEEKQPKACVAANEVSPFVIYETEGQGDGSISLIISGNHPGIQVFWYDDAGHELGTGIKIKGVYAGVYCYTILDQCCQLSDCIEVGTCNITTSATIIHPIGNVPMGSITLDLVSASEPITYEWDNGENTPTINELTPGTYCVTVSDGNGCHANQCFEVLNCPSITVSPNIVLHPSSDCGATDGWIKILNLNATGGVSPYTFKWFNPDGTPNTQQGSLYNLLSGSYCLEATDALGCKGKTCVFLGAKHEPLVDAQIAPACTGQNNGSIVVTAIDVDDGTSTYNFEWSNGLVTNGDFYSENFGLYSGTYTVTISSNAANCTVVKEFVVPQAVPTTALAVTTTVKHNCPGQNNGSITTTTTGGVAPFSYQWSTNPNEFGNPVKNNLGAGTYEVTVTDYCGSKVKTVVNLAPITIANSQVKSGCKDEGYASITVKNGNPSYTYHWSNGTNGNEVNSLSTGKHTVTVTDATGCTDSHEFTLVNKEFEIEVVGSCVNMNNGYIKFKISNPNLGPVSLNLNNQSLINTLTTQQYFEFVHEGLSSQYMYSFDLTIDGCSYNSTNQLIPIAASNTIEYVRNYTKDKDRICVFQEYCGGEPTDGAIIEKNATYDFINATNCEVPIMCEDIKIGVDKYKNKKTRGATFKAMLNALLGLGVYSDGLILDRIDRYNYLNNCATVYYCPATLEVNSTFGFGQGDGLESDGSGCWKVDCDLSDVHFCSETLAIDNPFVALTNSSFNGETISACNGASYTLYQLYLWKSALISQYQDDFLDSDLYNLIEDDGADNRAKCVIVTFCTSEDRLFEILNNPNIDNVDLGFLVSATVLEDIDDNNNQQVFCEDENSSSNFTLCVDNSAGFCELINVPGFQYIAYPNFPGFHFTNQNVESRLNSDSLGIIYKKFDKNQQTTILIKPNPFISNININLKSNSFAEYQIEILDISGRCFTKELYQVDKGEQLIEIKLEKELPPGIYFLKISDSKLLQKTFKLIKL
jgi:hypothetical protein